MAGGGGKIRERDVEIVAALSGCPDRSVHADPFVERTYTSRDIAQTEVCTNSRSHYTDSDVHLHDDGLSIGAS